MPLLHSLKITRRPVSRRLIQLASLSLAGFLAGLLTGCTPSEAATFFHRQNDSDWRTSSTYASAVATLPPSSATHTARYRPCAACDPKPTLDSIHPVHHRAK